ncbi:glucose-6-phosphate isomerase [Pseudonocardia humida]|uniref:Glucose-6-phosphate isomerase n=1 Tax=Pseudonocardia humida TaxID=2800819 RepID=A0ABT1A713_9PSEU|nr:glucose-6-phosphate isomerase [Pseudonocardia humida]MCO1658815.1 glucose-6-phosphate isomerase [Pseudonocardia humida]
MSSPDRAAEPPTGVVSDLVGGSVASRVAAGDPALWPGAAWPGWVRAARSARPMVGAVSALGETLRVAGLHRIVLVTTAGVGVAVEGLGVGTAPGTGLIVLDTADPESVADVLAGDLDTTALVTVLPPGATGPEAESVALVHEVVTEALIAEGLPAERHTVLIDVPDGPLARRASGATLLAGPPDVSGLWSSLSAYTLVPAGLAGADIGVLLAGADVAAAALAEDSPDNPALVLGAILAAAPTVALTGTPALVEYATELIAGGLGKDGRGPLAVRLDDPDAPLADLVRSAGVPDGALAIEVAGPVAGTGAAPALVERTDGGPGLRTEGSAAGQVLLWQHAVAVAAHLLAVDPTHRPAGTRPPADTATAFVDGFVDGAVAVRGGSWLPAGTDTVADALRALVDPSGAAPTHLAVHAYLDRESDASAAVLRLELARRTGLTTTFGWAPRCLAGTGQYDEGGPDAPVVCQLTGDAAEPGERPEELGERQRATADADAAALAANGRRVLRLHFVDRIAGLVTLAKAVQQL